jgi:hypothetical protein
MDVERAIEIVTAESLKTSVEYFLGGPDKLDIDEKHILSSLLRVIEYYSLRGDYQAYYDTIASAVETALETKEPPDGIIEVLDIKENLDGSADISFNIGKDNVSQLVGEGLGFLLIKAAYSVTTSDIADMCEAKKNS